MLWDNKDKYRNKAFEGNFKALIQLLIKRSISQLDSKQNKKPPSGWCDSKFVDKWHASSRKSSVPTAG